MEPRTTARDSQSRLTLRRRTRRKREKMDQTVADARRQARGLDRQSPSNPTPKTGPRTTATGSKARRRTRVSVSETDTQPRKRLRQRAFSRVGQGVQTMSGAILALDRGGRDLESITKTGGTQTRGHNHEDDEIDDFSRSYTCHSRRIAGLVKGLIWDHQDDYLFPSHAPFPPPSYSWQPCLGIGCNRNCIAGPRILPTGLTGGEGVTQGPGDPAPPRQTQSAADASSRRRDHGRSRRDGTAPKNQNKIFPCFAVATHGKTYGGNQSRLSRQLSAVPALLISSGWNPRHGSARRR